jgi:alpha-galactosidase/6-phospho-beta-glucosidase family protein
VITVALIGAGSVEFTRNVVADLCSYEELRGDVRITLHDIGPGPATPSRPTRSGGPRSPAPTS